MSAMIALCAGTLLVLLAWARARAGDDQGSGREILFCEHVWAASAAGITGGAAAVSARIHVVSNLVIAATSPANPSAFDVANAHQPRAMLHHHFERVVRSL
jgi:hypothetical protein